MQTYSRQHLNGDAWLNGYMEPLESRIVLQMAGPCRHLFLPYLQGLR
jgi:hypothetical protein